MKNQYPKCKNCKHYNIDKEYCNIFESKTDPFDLCQYYPMSFEKAKKARKLAETKRILEENNETKELIQLKAEQAIADLF